MIRSHTVRGFLFSFLLSLLASPAFAETIELVTYYPTSSNTGELHVGSLTVGTAYNAATPMPDGVAAIANGLWIGAGFDPRNPPPLGTLLQVMGVNNTPSNVLFLPGTGVGADIRMGIGTNNPQGPLHVVGVDNAASNVLFMPGGGTGTIGVGIGINPPPSLLGVGGNSGAAGTRQAITIGNAGFGVPTAEGTPSNGDKLVMWNDAATTYKAGIGLNAANELWLQSSGNNANNKITFYTSNASTAPLEQMRITADGNVGIGTTSPQWKLDVAGDLQVGRATPSGTGVNVGSVNFRDTTTGTWWHWTLRGPDQGSNLEMHVRPSGTGVPNYPLAMTPAGNVGIGTQSPRKKLDVNGDAMISGRFGTQNYSPDSGLPAGIAGGVHTWDVYAEGGLYAGRGGGANIIIQYDGRAWKPGRGPWGTLSDVRLKKNVQPMAGALEKMLALRGVTFEWKDPASQGNLTGTQMGMIGQEVAKVFPEWVSEDPRGMKVLSIRGFEALTVEAMRDQQREIAEMKERIRVLENERRTTSSDR